MNIFRVTLSILASLALIACGGGGGGGGGNGEVATLGPISTGNASDEVVLMAGTGTVVDGTVETSRYLLKSISWEVSPVTPSAADLELQNQKCTAVSKQDLADPILPGGGVGRSTWTCSMGVASTVNVKSDVLYKLLLVGLDSAGQSSTYTRYLRVKPNPSLADALAETASSNKINIITVGSLVGKPGQTLNLGAAAEWATTSLAGAAEPPSVIFTWSLGDGNEQRAKLLSTTGSNVQLYLFPETTVSPGAEGQTTAAMIPITVTATGDGVSASSTMFALIDPFEPLGPSVTPAVQDVVPNGQVCIRALDIDISDPKLFYKWSVEVGTQVPLGGENTLNLGFFAPSDPQLMTIRFAVGYYPITADYKGVYFVNALVRVTNTPTGDVFDRRAYCIYPAR